jgi:hypothetical protein
MKQIFIPICLFILFSFKCVSQNYSSKKILSYELGKTGLVHNIYFDNKFSNSSYGYRVGVGNNLSGELFFGKLSIGFYKLMGNKNRFFEFGIDIDRIVVESNSSDTPGLGSLAFPDYTTKIFSPNLNIGYRSYSKKGRLFRIGISPFYANKFLLGGYISFGLKQF